MTLGQGTPAVAGLPGRGLKLEASSPFRALIAPERVEEEEQSSPGRDPAGDRRPGRGEEPKEAPVEAPVERLPAPSPGRIAAEGEQATAPAAGELPARQLAEQMLRSVCVSQVGGKSSLHLEISTARLPRVGLQLTVEAGRLHARFSVYDPGQRDLLRSAAAELATSLQRRGLQVGTIQVDVDGGGRSTAGRPDTGGQGRRGGDRRSPWRPGRRPERGVVV